MINKMMLTARFLMVVAVLLIAFAIAVCIAYSFQPIVQELMMWGMASCILGAFLQIGAEWMENGELEEWD